MWVSKNEEWNSSHNDLSKYFIEKLKQRVDYSEVISNKHRTTNGFTLIAEIIEVATHTLKRTKSINRLISLLKEATSDSLSSNIINDNILKQYHKDIVKYYKDIDPNRFKNNEKDVNNILVKSQIHYERLKKDYYKNIIDQTEKIDFKDDKKFDTLSIKIDIIIDCLVPYLLFIGYSPTSISEIAYKNISKINGLESPLKIIRQFDNNKKGFKFLLITSGDASGFEPIKIYLEKKNYPYNTINIGDIKNSYILDDCTITNPVFYEIVADSIDPHNFIRNLYERGLKNFVISKERVDLGFYMDYFDNIYWKFKAGNSNYKKSNFQLDPINVKMRESTLIETLVKTSSDYGFPFAKHQKLPIINSISDSVFYYNLALGSKSIENSIFLLWTSLETLIPYRLHDFDIENVQHFVSRSLSIGSIGRDIYSFIKRVEEFKKIYPKHFSTLDCPTDFGLSSDGLLLWINWLAIDWGNSKKDDPFEVFKTSSNLLCKQFCSLNNIFSSRDHEKGQASYLLERINTSQSSISHQLDRIYLHRNQIVHSGKFINEYSNLWSHLEWYVGKLLSFLYIEYLKTNGSEVEKFDKTLPFMKLEAEADMLINLLENNKDRKINELSFSYPLLCSSSWQFF